MKKLRTLTLLVIFVCSISAIAIADDEKKKKRPLVLAPVENSIQNNPAMPAPGRNAFNGNEEAEKEIAKINKTAKQMASDGESQEAINAYLRKAYAKFYQKHGRQGNERGPRGNRGGGDADLMKMRDEMNNKAAQMKKDGKSQAEIDAYLRDARKKLFELAASDPGNQRQGSGRQAGGRSRGQGGWGSDLTNEQRATMRKEMQKMRESGASREDYRAKMTELMEKFEAENKKKEK